MSQACPEKHFAPAGPPGFFSNWRELLNLASLRSDTRRSYAQAIES
jgi:hypothetical protein